MNANDFNYIELLISYSKRKQFKMIPLDPSLVQYIKTERLSSYTRPRKQRADDSDEERGFMLCFNLFALWNNVDM